MKVLIIEKEQEERDTLIRSLKREGYLCEHAANFQEACKKVVSHEYECILLDPDLPGGDGMKLIRLLKSQDPDAGIIVFSARNSADDRILGLNEGADDFLSKPFNQLELNARIKAVVRRKNRHVSDLMDFGMLKIRTAERKVEANGMAVPLTRKEFDILVYLARNRNRVVTKDSIAGNLWGDEMDDKGTYDYIYAHIKNLRKKLAGFGCGDYLRTVYGLGYRFNTPS